MLPMPAATRVSHATPQNMLWTVDRFHYLGDLGMFEGLRAMLIDGVIVEEGPMNPPHRIALELTADAVRAAFGPGWRVCVQMPLVLGQSLDPQPDVAVVAGSPRGSNTHPTTAALVVEVSDSSFRYDTTVKLRVYAGGGIADYWVLDVNARQLHVYRDPTPDPADPPHYTYATHHTFGPADAVAPLAAPHATVTVADLLP